MADQHKTAETPEFNRKIILTNNIEQINSLHDFVDSIGDELKLSPALALNLNLALEEIVSNVILYAYPPESSENKIFIEFVKSGDQLKFIISDYGKPFDPTTKDEPDITLEAVDRPIGGLGIFLVRQIMDDITYYRENNMNKLVLCKSV
ncbi:Anti-Sigma Regulatory Factor [Bacteroidales bacterium CF]|jgi:Anti-sigma regulatory factor (Ser/Thr protein kinase)|nr:Anti-Sigma Regulatory Factor [Bacteroidales bacterium CF]